MQKNWDLKMNNIDFSIVSEFENQVSLFFGARYGIAVDCCTHAIELCLRYVNAKYIYSPKQTYISVPFLSNKLGISLIWNDERWQDWYVVWEDEHKKIIDSAVLWRKDSYISGTYMCLSFQYQKHLSLGRGGMILCDDEEASRELKKMSYDGRLPNIPWRDQDISSFGYHYYMTPETAKLGLEKLQIASVTEPRKWTINDWPDLTKMKIFK